MDDDLDAMMIDVRANTQGFAADIAKMRSQFDTTLIDGFSRSGDVLERSLSGALRNGKLGFDDLKRAAINVLDDIAGRAMQAGMAQMGGAGGGLLSAGTSLLSSILGLPGRATGGNVAPNAAYLVGERGPEVFVPTAAGRIEQGASMAQPRDVRVSIHLTTPPGGTAAQNLQRSSRQVASAVRRALTAD
ncbi:tail tape measure protein [Croceicoccus sp. F390]|uniref:Tail tape measure protein n=1 Tax=Croceicoccus esteveae TaxID=3075597 RepID=A0ABU2ZIU0_9SPHN|nr:tail tape measure protein [Croceicoccus sp. F390]MDT0576533.1 tail tape measure protein [Croceicoccus sp. F390]